MKKTSFLILGAAFLFGAMGCNKPAQLTGSVDMPDGAQLYLRDLSTEMADCVDTAIVKDKMFTFSKQQRPGIYGVDDSQNFYVVVLGDEPLSFDATSRPVRYEGKESGLLNEYERLTNAFLAGLEPLRAREHELESQPASEERDAQLKDVEKSYRDVQMRFDEDVLGLVMNNPNNDYALYLATTLEVAGEPLNRLAEWLGTLDERSKASPFYQIVQEHIATESKLQPGMPFIDLTVKTADGQLVKLSEVAGKGKPVLVELWASWCRACRASMPKLITVYEKYKDKGFVVFAVSCDEDAGKWQDAVAKDGLPWVNYIASGPVMGPESPMFLYGTSGLPFNVLLDAEGKIVGRNIESEQLDEILATMTAAPAPVEE